MLFSFFKGREKEWKKHGFKATKESQKMFAAITAKVHVAMLEIYVGYHRMHQNIKNIL